MATWVSLSKLNIEIQQAQDKTSMIPLKLIHTQGKKTLETKEEKQQ